MHYPNSPRNPSAETQHEANINTQRSYDITRKPSIQRLGAREQMSHIPHDLMRWRGFATTLKFLATEWSGSLLDIYDFGIYIYTFRIDKNIPTPHLKTFITSSRAQVRTGTGCDWYLECSRNSDWQMCDPRYRGFNSTTYM